MDNFQKLMVFPRFRLVLGVEEAADGWGLPGEKRAGYAFFPFLIGRFPQILFSHIFPKKASPAEQSLIFYLEKHEAGGFFSPLYP